MIGPLLVLAAGLLPPSNGVRFVDEDPVAYHRRHALDPVAEPSPSALGRPRGWVVPARVTVPMRRWADKVLARRLPIGARRVKVIGRVRVLARVEWHRSGNAPWHRGVSLYVPERKR